jgi:hypothetical protein
MFQFYKLKVNLSLLFVLTNNNKIKSWFSLPLSTVIFYEVFPNPCLWELLYSTFNFLSDPQVIASHLVVWWHYINTSGPYSWDPSQKFHRNIDSILNDYGAMDIWNWRLFEAYVEHQGHSWVLQHRKFSVLPLFCLLCVHAPCISKTPHMEILGGVWSGDHSSQFCGPPQPIHQSWICSFRYSITCWLKCGVPHHTRSTSVIMFFVVQIIFNFSP